MLSLIFNEMSFFILHILTNIFSILNFARKLVPFFSKILFLDLNISVQLFDFIKQILFIHSNSLPFGSKSLKLSLLIVFKSRKLIFLNFSQTPINLVLLYLGLQLHVFLRRK